MSERGSPDRKRWPIRPARRAGLAVGDILTTAEVAELLQLRPTTVADYARRGIIPSRMLGRHRRFLAEEVQAWIKDPHDTPSGSNVVAFPSKRVRQRS